MSSGFSDSQEEVFPNNLCGKAYLSTSLEADKHQGGESNAENKCNFIFILPDAPVKFKLILLHHQVILPHLQNQGEWNKM